MSFTPGNDDLAPYGHKPLQCTPARLAKPVPAQAKPLSLNPAEIRKCCQELGNLTGDLKKIWQIQLRYRTEQGPLKLVHYTNAELQALLAPCAPQPSPSKPAPTLKASAIERIFSKKAPQASSTPAVKVIFSTEMNPDGLLRNLREFKGVISEKHPECQITNASVNMAGQTGEPVVAQPVLALSCPDPKAPLQTLKEQQGQLGILTIEGPNSPSLTIDR